MLSAPFYYQIDNELMFQPYRTGAVLIVFYAVVVPVVKLLLLIMDSGLRALLRMRWLSVQASKLGS